MVLIHDFLIASGIVVVTMLIGFGIFFRVCTFGQHSTMWKSMNRNQTLTHQMASEIALQAICLNQNRLHLFLGWLRSHSSSIKIQKVDLPIELMRRQLEQSTANWFESLPVKGLLWEYQLILDEIGWWRDLDESILSKFMIEDGKKGI